MRVRNLCKGLARRLGVVAVASSMSLGLASDGYAATVTIPDSGFEDHVIDSNSGYAYGAAGQAGGDTGFNNPSATNGGSSPWSALAYYGNGIGGYNASWMQNSGYQTPNSGDQSAEVQGVMAQNLTDTFSAGMFYVATVAAYNDGSANDVTVGLYDAGAVNLIHGDVTQNTSLILSEPSLVTATPSVVGGAWSDHSFNFSEASLAGLVGKNIGIAVFHSDSASNAQGPDVDDIRLESFVPEPGSLALLGLGGVLLVGLRRRK